jgi:hypothetical protein
MSTQVLDPAVEEAPDLGPRRRRWRRAVVTVAVVVLLGATAAVVLVRKPFDKDLPAPSGAAPGTTLEPVREGPLSSQVFQSGTLSYTARDDGTPYDVVNHAKGIFTWVPRVGDEINCGKVIYWVDDHPVVLLCGARPPYRNLAEGDEGWDVKMLNDNLVKLGYVDKAHKHVIDDAPEHFGWRTRKALKKLQKKVGQDDTGKLDLGDAVFLPNPVRITTTAVKLGGNAVPGSPVAQASTTGREVVVNLEATQQSQVKVGDPAQITLPDNRTTTGKVSRIGTVASSPGDSGGQNSQPTTIPAYLTLDKPQAVGGLDQAPVQVRITTAGVANALIVPVTALLGASSGFAVEKVDAAGGHTMVPVTLGLFDTADGLVQVTGDLKANDQVVVPSR